MNKREFKQWRSYQVAANILYRYCGGIIIEQQDDVLYDFRVTIKDSNQSFLVEIKGSTFAQSASYVDYINMVERSNLIQEHYRKPLVLMLVNESKETASFGFVVTWNRGKATIYRKVSFTQFNQRNANILIDKIHAMDDTIRVLSKYGLNVLKKIRVSTLDSNNAEHVAYVLYTRDITEKYKMKEKNVTDEREKMQRLIFGIPEREYPSDLIDELIQQGLQQNYPKISLQTSVLFSTYDVNELQNYREHYYHSANVVVAPDLTQLSDESKNIFNGVTLIVIPIELYFELPEDRFFFRDLVIQTHIEPQEWIEKYYEIQKSLATKHSIRDFFN